MKLLCALLTVVSLSGCCAGLDEEIIREKLSKELHVGDSREKVELVLKSHGMDFSYDEHQQRYQSGIGGEDCNFNPFNKVVAVLIYINKSGRVSKIEVSNSYTFL